MSTKHTAAEIKQAAEQIESQQNIARAAYAECRRISDEFGVPYEVPHNLYIPAKYAELKAEYEDLPEEEKDAWAEARGLDPEDIYYGKYNEGYAGWQSSYC